VNLWPDGEINKIKGNLSSVPTASILGCLARLHDLIITFLLMIMIMIIRLRCQIMPNTQLAQLDPPLLAKLACLAAQLFEDKIQEQVRL